VYDNRQGGLVAIVLPRVSAGASCELEGEWSNRQGCAGGGYWASLQGESGWLLTTRFIKLFRDPHADKHRPRNKHRSVNNKLNLNAIKEHSKSKNFSAVSGLWPTVYAGVLLFNTTCILGKVIQMNQRDATMLHLVGSSILLYLIDDARSNKNQTRILFQITTM